MPAFILSLLLMQPIMQTIPLTESLKLEVPYLKERTRAPSEGYLLSLGDLARIQTEIKSADSACILRLDTLANQSRLELERVQDQFEERIAGYVIRIGDLEKLNLGLEANLTEIKREYGLFRYVSYGMGAALLGLATYAVVFR